MLFQITTISRVYLILPAVSHELLIMHRRAPTCFSAYISWRTKSCIPPHPLQTTSSPLYPNQEAQRHVFFFFFSFLFFFYGDALVITATANRKKEKGVNVDVVDDHRRPLLKEDWQLVTSSTRLSSGCNWHRPTGEGYVHTVQVVQFTKTNTRRGSRRKDGYTHVTVAELFYFDRRNTC